MIQPISLIERTSAIVLTKETAAAEETIGAEVPVTAWEIDTGKFKGATVAMTRLLPLDTILRHSEYQTLRPTAAGARHVTINASFEGALHQVMALAYAHAAACLDREAIRAHHAA